MMVMSVAPAISKPRNNCNLAGFPGAMLQYVQDRAQRKQATAAMTSHCFVCPWALSAT